MLIQIHGAYVLVTFNFNESHCIWLHLRACVAERLQCAEVCLDLKRAWELAELALEAPRVGQLRHEAAVRNAYV